MGGESDGGVHAGALVVYDAEAAEKKLSLWEEIERRADQGELLLRLLILWYPDSGCTALFKFLQGLALLRHERLVSVPVGAQRARGGSRTGIPLIIAVTTLIHAVLTGLSGCGRRLLCCGLLICCPLRLGLHNYPMCHV